MGSGHADINKGPQLHTVDHKEQKQVHAPLFVAIYQPWQNHIDVHVGADK
jgi:hypothetical protein